jgi:hypothetical protein
MQDLASVHLNKQINRGCAAGALPVRDVRHRPCLVPPPRAAWARPPLEVRPRPALPFGELVHPSPTVSMRTCAARGNVAARRWCTAACLHTPGREEDGERGRSQLVKMAAPQHARRWRWPRPHGRSPVATYAPALACVGGSGRARAGGDDRWIRPRPHWKTATDFVVARCAVGRRARGK